MIKWRFGDKPNRLYPDSLAWLEEQGIYVATQKLDGYRCFIVKDSTKSIIETWNGNPDRARGSENNLFFLSNRSMEKGGPTNHPISDDIVQLVEEMDLPDKTMIDCEWMARRSIGQCPERLYPLGVMYLRDEWVGKKPEQERLALLDEMFSFDESPIMLPTRVASGFRDFFNTQKEIEYSEGVVFKNLTSKVMGNRKECVKNPLWIKIRYRDGASGRDVYYD